MAEGWKTHVLMLVVLVLAGGLGAGPVAAQEKAPQEKAPQEKAPQEKAPQKSLSQEPPRRRAMRATGTAKKAARSVERPAALDRQYRRAWTAWKTGASLLEAKARLDRVLHRVPDDWASRKLRAEVLLEMDRPEAALKDARRAAQLRPQDGRARLLYAEAARRSGETERARKELEAAAEHLPDRSDVHTRLSWNAFLLGRPAQAEAYARVALALDSTSAPAYRQLARVFAQTDRPEKAASVLARAVRSSVLSIESLRRDDVLRPLLDRPPLHSLKRQR